MGTTAAADGLVPRCKRRGGVDATRDRPGGTRTRRSSGGTSAVGRPVLGAAFVSRCRARRPAWATPVSPLRGAFAILGNVTTRRIPQLLICRVDLRHPARGRLGDLGVAAGEIGMMFASEATPPGLDRRRAGIDIDAQHLIRRTFWHARIVARRYRPSERKAGLRRCLTGTAGGRPLLPCRLAVERRSSPRSSPLLWPSHIDSRWCTAHEPGCRGAGHRASRPLTSVSFTRR